MYLGDCLDVMDELIKQNIKIDMILTDIPYGTTQCKWDSVIPFEPMWRKIDKLVKSNGCIALFGSEPFSSQLRCSNIKNYKYDWYMRKTKPQGFPNAKKMPLKDIETISIFYKNLPIYNPQGLIKIDKKIKNSNSKINNKTHISGQNGGSMKIENYTQEYTNYPRQIIEVSPVYNAVHPTQKPVELLEYLIKTYTNENETVLDFTMGSGSTGVACINTNRKFIGIEKEEKYFDISVDRIRQAEINKIKKEDI